ncbi:Mu transposase domain-containing protein [Streptomyces sp. WAC01490]|uniref:Mu transposase domain-containing protein n=1 Tax=unclassified Streptomyces TaxID=2593676 RepID=UPI003F5160B4
MSLTEVAKETGLNWQTVSKYLAADGPAAPPRRSPNGRSKARVIDEFAPLVDSMLRAEILMKAAVIHERVTAQYGFTGNLYSVPARRVRPRQLVEIRATKSQIMLHSTMADSSGETLLATHPRAIGRGVRVVEEAHWDGLPTGKGRWTTTGDVLPQPRRERPRGEESGPLRALLNRAAATHIEVGRRPLSVYDELTGTRPFTTHPSTRETS